MSRQKRSRPSAREERLAYELVTARDADTCQRCLRGCGPATRDHRQGRGVGGRTVASNLQLLGGSGTTGCHGWVTGNPEAAMAEGWTVPSWADPAEWPAARYFPSRHGHALGWCLYDDEGNVTEISAIEAAVRMKGLTE